MKLPLLQFTSEQFADTSLENTLVIACQHILGTTVDLFEVLFERGLKPENAHVLGKCYSTNLKSLRKLKQIGINVSDDSIAFDSTRSFDEQFAEYVSNFLQQVIKKESLGKFKKVIILDDGGQLLLFANDFIADKKNLVGIEQTSSGFEKIKNTQLQFPVINVAKSEVKLKVEAPLIAHLVVGKIAELLNSNHKILVVGQGAIGRNIYKLLKQKHQVVRYDAVSDKIPFPGKYENKLGQFDVIVGATGQSIIMPGDFAQLNKKCVLISASSSDREFSAVHLRRKLDTKINDCHKNIKYNGVCLLNNGFPINFDGKEHSLPAEQAQLTRALLAAAVFQGIIQKGKGVKDLDLNTQILIAKQFKKYHN